MRSLFFRLIYCLQTSSISAYFLSYISLISYIWQTLKRRNESNMALISMQLLDKAKKLLFFENFEIYYTLKKNHCWYLSHQCVKKNLRGWIFNLENRSSNSKGQDQIWWTHEERHGIIGVVVVEGKTRFFFQ
jgi:hypothetical protein